MRSAVAPGPLTSEDAVRQRGDDVVTTGQVDEDVHGGLKDARHLPECLLVLRQAFA